MTGIRRSLLAGAAAVALFAAALGLLLPQLAEPPPPLAAPPAVSAPAEGAEPAGVVASHVKPEPTEAPAPADAPVPLARAAEVLASVAGPATPVPTPLPTPTPGPRLSLVGPALPAVAGHGVAPVRNPDAPDPDPTTQHVIVVDGESGAVLFQSNAYEPVAPASTTKIMTALLAVEYGHMDEQVVVDVDARDMPGSSLMGLEPWFDVTMRDLLYGLMLPSGNDAALAIARRVAGSDEAFVALMNEKAAALGLRCTHFANPHGLDDPGHHSCPADMVTMARYAMQYPLFREVVAARTYDLMRSNVAYTLYNVNPILGYPGADGVKSGFTDDAGRALVASVVQDGHRIYVAFMRSESGGAVDGSLLLNWAFNHFTWPPADPVPVSR